MLRTIVFGLVAAAASTNALWLAVANADGETNAGGGIYGSPYCLVGKGDTQEEALSKATDFVNGNIIIAGGHCDQLPYQHTNQLGGFWDDYGTINYEDDNWHWYCNPGTGQPAACDGGDGAPKRMKRNSVKFGRENVV